MTRIAVQVADDEKAAMLVELLSSLTFVDFVNIEEVNGTASNGRSSNGHSNNGSEFHDSYPTPAVSTDRPAMLREQAAFNAMRSSLLAEYSGKHVAVFQGAVIDHDSDKLSLIARIDNSHPDCVVLIREVTEHEKPPLTYRSIRFARE